MIPGGYTAFWRYGPSELLLDKAGAYNEGVELLSAIAPTILLDGFTTDNQTVYNFATYMPVNRTVKPEAGTHLEFWVKIAYSGKIESVQLFRFTPGPGGPHSNLILKWWSEQDASLRHKVVGAAIDYWAHWVGSD